MALSRIAGEFAAEITHHDWSDAPYRIDRAGHQIEDDRPDRRTSQPLSTEEATRIRTNVMWVVAQVLGHADPNFSAVDFARACGVQFSDGIILAGVRKDADGRYQAPGTRL